MKSTTRSPASQDADARAYRINGIRDSATVRAALGQTAAHALLDDGRHQVFVVRGDRVLSYTGDTLNEAIRKAKSGQEDGTQ